MADPRPSAANPWQTAIDSRVLAGSQPSVRSQLSAGSQLSDKSQLLLIAGAGTGEMTLRPSMTEVAMQPPTMAPKSYVATVKGDPTFWLSV